MRLEHTRSNCRAKSSGHSLPMSAHPKQHHHHPVRIHTSIHTIKLLLAYREGSSLPATSTSVTGPSELMKRRVLAAVRGATWVGGVGGRKAAASAGSARRERSEVVAVRMVFVVVVVVVVVLRARGFVAVCACRLCVCVDFLGVHVVVRRWGGVEWMHQAAAGGGRRRARGGALGVWGSPWACVCVSSHPLLRSKHTSRRILRVQSAALPLPGHMSLVVAVCVRPRAG
jgi:hypothetical protein